LAIETGFLGRPARNPGSNPAVCTVPELCQPIAQYFVHSCSTAARTPEQWTCWGIIVGYEWVGARSRVLSENCTSGLIGLYFRTAHTLADSNV